jgi:hypothetical protein
VEDGISIRPHGSFSLAGRAPVASGSARNAFPGVRRQLREAEVKRSGPVVPVLPFYCRNGPCELKPTLLKKELKPTTEFLSQSLLVLKSKYRSCPKKSKYRSNIAM